MSAVESWFAPAAAAVAEPLPRARPRRPAPAPTRARQPKPQQSRPTRERGRRSFRIRGSIVWMAVLALMLVGVVAVNAAVLRANVSVNNTDNQIAHLQGVDRALASQLSAATAAPRAEKWARDNGLVPAQGTDISYFDLLQP